MGGRGLLPRGAAAVEAAIAAVRAPRECESERECEAQLVKGVSMGPMGASSVVGKQKRNDESKSDHRKIPIIETHLARPSEVLPSPWRVPMKRPLVAVKCP